MKENLFKIVACHLIGDYVLQSDYVSKNKGKNWYILFVHSFLYCVPWAVTFGKDDSRLPILFSTHMVIDALKARYKKIDIVDDQVLHYLIGLMYLKK